MDVEQVVIGAHIRRKLSMLRHFFKSVRFDGLIFAENGFGSYCIPAGAGHRPAAHCIIGGRTWEPETVTYMMDHARRGDVVTAGAFFGDALPALSSAAGSHNTVWAFEPNPENFRCASITTLLNRLSNVRLMNAGLGERSGMFDLIVRDFSGRPLGGASQISTVRDDSGKERGCEMVQVNVVAIDDVVPETSSVSLIHLDIEGFEDFAILGAAKTIARCKPKLVIEYGLKAGSPASEFLKGFNYALTGNLDSENVILEC